MTLRRTGGIPILMYHCLGDAPNTDDIPYYVGQSSFYKQMRFLKLGGYHSITISQLVSAIQDNQKVPKRSVVITFDDGHESFERIGVPILEKFGYTATMFIITSKVDKPNYLTSKSIQTLQGREMHFESHSHTHPILTKLPDAEAELEVSESKAILESLLRSPVRFFAYRGGHYNEKTQNMVKGAGYTAAVCSKPGLNSETGDLFALQRMGIHGNDDLGRFARKLLGDTVYRRSIAYLRHFLRV